MAKIPNLQMLIQREERSRKRFIPYFKILSGESINGVWLLQAPERVKMHTIRMPKQSKRPYISVICNPDGCYACQLKEGGSKSVGFATDRFVMLVWDPRIIHMVQAEGSDFPKPVECTNPTCNTRVRACPYCQESYPQEVSGLKRWDMSGQWGFLWLSMEESCALGCACGGKIQMSESGEPICLQCENTDPKGIMDVAWRISKAGSEKSTTYSFTECQGSKPVEVANWEDIDLKEMVAPDSFEKQKDELAILRPGFTSGFQQPIQPVQRVGSQQQQIFPKKVTIISSQPTDDDLPF